MQYKIFGSLRTPSAIEAMHILEAHVQEALAKGGQLVGGVSVAYCAADDKRQAGYEAFQAVQMPVA